MDAKFQPSFIPKQPIASIPMPVSSSISLLSVISGVVFVLTLGLVGAVLIAERIYARDIANLNEIIVKEKNQFELSTIAQLKQVSAQTKFANDLLDKHIALSSFFEEIGKVTYQNVAFSSLNMSAKDGNVSIALSGTAGSYNSLILQRDFLEQVKFLKEPEFSGFVLEKNGSVKFSFKASLDPKFVDYKTSIGTN